MNEDVPIQCPWCFESLVMSVTPDDLGTMYEDCEVCCRPWRVEVWREDDGPIRVRLERS